MDLSKWRDVIAAFGTTKDYGQLLTTCRAAGVRLTGCVAHNWCFFLFLRTLIEDGWEAAQVHLKHHRFEDLTFLVYNQYPIALPSNWPKFIEMMKA